MFCCDMNFILFKLRKTTLYLVKYYRESQNMPDEWHLLFRKSKRIYMYGVRFERREMSDI